MKTVRMIIKDRRTDGAVPVDVKISADNDNFIIQWRECDLLIPVDSVLEACADE